MRAAAVAPWADIRGSSINFSKLRISSLELRFYKYRGVVTAMAPARKRRGIRREEQNGGHRDQEESILGLHETGISRELCHSRMIKRKLLLW